MADGNYSGPERRRYKRLSKPFSLRIQDKAGGAFAPWDIVLLNDISSVGVSFNTEKPMKEGTILKMKINFGLDSKAIECEGKIMHAEDAKIVNLYKMGVAFLNISPEDAERINQFVAKS